MKKLLSFMKGENGFTLIEMMIVIMIISMLLLIAVPSLTKNNDVVGAKSCDATVKVAQSQMAAYKAEKGSLPATINDLVSEGYLNSEDTKCPGGKVLTITNGAVGFGSEASE